MSIVLAIILCIVQVALFYSESSVDHAMWQFWWVPLVAGYLYLVVFVIARDQASSLLRTGLTVAAGLTPVLIVWLFNDTMTIFLIGSWLLVFAATWGYFHPDANSSRRLFRILGVLVGLSLLFLPISINRIAVKLPNLSADTHLAIYDGVDDKPVQSARYFQRVDDHEELKVYLSAEIYFQQPHEAPLLRVEIEREKIVVVLQDIIYEHAVGFLKLSLQKFEGPDLSEIKPAMENAPFRLQTPPGKGAIIDELKVGDIAWLQLPHLRDHAVSGGDQVTIRVVRLLFWVLIFFAAWHWRPRKKPGA